MENDANISLDLKVEIKEEFSPNNTLAGSYGN